VAEHTFDLVVLGAGSGGYAAALRASQLGMSVGLIEKDKVGGTCLHVGCIPTKALLHAAEVADSARHSEMFGVKATLEGVDLPAVNTYRDGIVASKHKGLQGLIKARGITTIEGTGKLISPTTIAVGEDTAVGKNVILATGSYPRSLPGLDIGGRIITSEQALALDWIPSKVIVLGGGVIGVEFASVWRSFGAEVTIVEGLPRLVPAEDESISKQFERAYRKRGINFHTGVRFQSATQDDTSVTVTLEDGTTETADLLLVAVGRGPKTDGMGFEEVGVTMDRGFVLTDERLRTNIPGVFAVEAPGFKNQDSYTDHAALSSFLENYDLHEFPLCILCDDSDFLSFNVSNFIWATFTRTNPSHDIQGVHAFTENKHWGCKGTLIFDARIKPHHAPPLIIDANVSNKVDTLFKNGGELASFG